MKDPVKGQNQFQKPQSKGRSLRTDAGNVMWFFYLAISILLILTGLGAAKGGYAAGITAVMWASGCLATGTCVGFLFGIPKILQRTAEEEPDAESGKGIASRGSDQSYRQQVNTNLTEISDWLTKIIVGLGLINLKAIPEFIGTKASVLANSLKGFDGTGYYEAFAVAIMVAFPALGFLFGYLSTRLYLAGAFARADRESISTTREVADAASGAVESLNESVAVLFSKINQMLRPQEGDSFGGTLLSADLPKENRDQTVRETILRLADDYDSFRSDSKQERIAARNRISNEMASVIGNRDGIRNFVTEQIVASPNDGLISGLATAINADPTAEDLRRLLKIGMQARRKHARYKVATALGKLFDARLANVQDVTAAVEILSTYSRDGADVALKRRVHQTLAQIGQSTGLSVGISPS